jgi:hypothetical protein
MIIWNMIDFISQNKVIGKLDLTGLTMLAWGVS